MLITSMHRLIYLAFADDKESEESDQGKNFNVASCYKLFGFSA